MAGSLALVGMVVVPFCEALPRRAWAEHGLQVPLQVRLLFVGSFGLVLAQLGQMSGVELGVGCERPNEAFRGWMLLPGCAQPQSRMSSSSSPGRRTWRRRSAGGYPSPPRPQARA